MGLFSTKKGILEPKLVFYVPKLAFFEPLRTEKRLLCTELGLFSRHFLTKMGLLWTKVRKNIPQRTFFVPKILFEAFADFLRAYLVCQSIPEHQQKKNDDDCLNNKTWKNCRQFYNPVTNGFPACCMEFFYVLMI